MEETVNFGILCLLPVAVILVFALVTKRTFAALFLGSIVAMIMYYKTKFFTPTVELVQSVISDEIWIFVAFALFGYFVVLLERSKGTIGFANFLSRWANTQKKSLVAAWVLGIIVFLDDFLNILTVSSAMMPLADKHKTPREFFAYLLDSTGAPVCVLIPLSTWAIFYADLAGTEFDIAGVATYASGMDAYIHAIPFMFYSWVTVFMVPAVALGIVPKIGPMKKAFKRVQETGQLWSDDSARLNLINATEEDVNSTSQPKMRNFLVPLVVIIIAMLITEDMVSSLLITLLVMFLMYIPTKSMKFSDFCDALQVGINNMLPVMIILVGCYMVRDSMNLIQMPQFVVNAAVPYCTPQLLPAITFVVVAFMAFVTGSSWGVPAIAVPILMPLAFASGASPILVLGSLVAAASFGSHACFYADATVLSSQASKITNMDHALSQIPYAVISAGIAVILFLVFGFIMA
ncbi:MAG: sodium:proton antiporter [Clostridiales bacterium]|nr:sodium:proton antiporter [Clostridiales bacterium]